MTDEFSRVFEKIGTHSFMCLATSNKNRVTARTLSVIVIKRKFYFQTDCTSLKFQQLIENNRAALCFNNFQFEGTVKNLGSPLQKENSEILKKYIECFEKSYKNYSHMKNERFLVFIPETLETWDYENGKPYQDFYDLKKGTYKKEYYNNSK